MLSGSSDVFVGMFAVAGAVWALSLLMSFLGLWCSFEPRRWVGAVILPFLALVVAYYGLAHFTLKASRTVNGEVQWKVDSKWFFAVALIVAGVCLVVGVFRNRRRIFESFR